MVHTSDYEYVSISQLRFLSFQVPPLWTLIGCALTTCISVSEVFSANKICINIPIIRSTRNTQVFMRFYEPLRNFGPLPLIEINLCKLYTMYNSLSNHFKRCTTVCQVLFFDRYVQSVFHMLHRYGKR